MVYFYLCSRVFLFIFQATLWSKLFKHQLALDHNDEAYAAMIANPDPSRFVGQSHEINLNILFILEIYFIIINI